ncbi:MAG: hypothetical protein RL681_172 [Candidatus Parcubacteria bacterium]
MQRSAEEIKMRCRSILGRPDVVSLVAKSSSPTAAHDMAMEATGDQETAKAARWLAVLRRDYPSTYHEVLSHAQSGTARKGKGDEEPVRT